MTKQYTIKVPFLDGNWCYVQELLKFDPTKDEQDTRIYFDSLYEAKNNGNLWKHYRIYEVENEVETLVYEK